jgi:polyhydroxyalkanoate synthesis regulator phasin
MKKIAFFLAVVGLLAMPLGAGPLRAGEVDVLINKLVEKGILSGPEARQLLTEMQKEGARQETAVKKVAEETAKEVAKKDTKSASVKLPSWLQKTTTAKTGGTGAVSDGGWALKPR